MQDTPEVPDRAATTILAFDFGLKRIGVAVGQTITGSASPLGVIRNGTDGPDHDRIAALVSDWHPDLLVVGMPLAADGSPTEMARLVGAFVESLDRHALPVVTVDERHTSGEAEAGLKHARQSGWRRRVRKADVDAAAAVLIAERYLRSS